MISSVSEDCEELKPYLDFGMKIVSINQTNDDFTTFRNNFDNRKGGRIGTRRLIERGTAILRI